MIHGARVHEVTARVRDLVRLERRQLRSRGSVLLAMLLAYIPGFALPFAVAAVAAGYRSDALLLATSTAVTVSSAVSLPYEAAWASTAADARARSGSLSLNAMRHGLWQSLLISVLVTAVLMPAFSVTYFLSDQIDRGELLVSLVCTLLLPIAAGVGGLSSGILNAYGRVPTNLVLQGIRGMLALASVAFVVAGAPIWIIAIAFSVGESLRAVLATVLARRCLDPSRAVQAEAPTIRAVLQHVGGLSVLGLWPIIARAFFAAAPAGTVTRFEMADRIFFAATQVCNNLLVFPRVAVVAERMRRLTLGEVTAAELRVVLGASAALAVLLSGLMLVLYPYLPASLQDAVPWAIALLASLPAGIGGTVASRLAVASKNAWIISVTSLIGVVVNLGGNVAGSLLLGPFGVVLSTVLCRWMLLLITAAMLRRRGRAPLLTRGVEVAG